MSGNKRPLSSVEGEDYPTLDRKGALPTKKKGKVKGKKKKKRRQTLDLRSLRNNLGNVNLKELLTTGDKQNDFLGNIRWKLGFMKPLKAKKTCETEGKTPSRKKK